MTSSGEDDDIDDEDTSKPVVSDVPLFFRLSLVELSLKASQSHNVMDHNNDDFNANDDGNKSCNEMSSFVCSNDNG